MSLYKIWSPEDRAALLPTGSEGERRTDPIHPSSFLQLFQLRKCFFEECHIAASESLQPSQQELKISRSQNVIKDVTSRNSLSVFQIKGGFVDFVAAKEIHALQLLNRPFCLSRDVPRRLASLESPSPPSAWLDGGRVSAVPRAGRCINKPYWHGAVWIRAGNGAVGPMHSALK